MSPHHYNSLCLDLTHPVGDATVSWPTASKFRVTQAVAKDSGSGYWYEARDFSQAEHSGTHTDAPAHFAKVSTQHFTERHFLLLKLRQVTLEKFV